MNKTESCHEGDSSCHELSNGKIFLYAVIIYSDNCHHMGTHDGMKTEKRRPNSPEGKGMAEESFCISYHLTGVLSDHSGSASKQSGNRLYVFSSTVSLFT